uniref:Uncharacterized protein n=1 Tax=Brassica oleracea TaxID=3712 RepID=A0A3P6AUT2_BRAOL|nr:unnamed protein product [Brassica oleracea]
MLVRIPSDYLRQKIIEKNVWYVGDSMFHASLWSSSSTSSTPSETIQIWAHLTGVPLDLRYKEGLSLVAGLVGEPKETDDFTLNLVSLTLSHVKVEVKLSEPLPRVVEFVRQSGEVVEVQVDYPWVPPTCAHCNNLGHISKNCLLLPAQKEAPKVPKVGLSKSSAPRYVAKPMQKAPLATATSASEGTSVVSPALIPPSPALIPLSSSPPLASEIAPIHTPPLPKTNLPPETNFLPSLAISPPNPPLFVPETKKKPFKIFFWNVRGLNDPDKHQPFCSWLNSHKPLFGSILETHIKESNMSFLMGKLCGGWNFTSNHASDEDGRIVLIWQPSVMVRVLHQSAQTLTCEVKIPGS